MTPKLSVAILLALTSVAFAACSDEDGSNMASSTPPPTRPTTTSHFPYPPLEFRWDIAVPLGEQERAAATTALEAEVLESRLRSNKEEGVIQQLNSMVTYGHRWASDGIRPLPETGGSLLRAVDVEKKSDSQWIVTYCVYNTPGGYSNGDNGQLRLSDPNWVYSPYADVVDLTTDRSGINETSTTPRLLVSGSARPELQTYPGRPNDLPRQTCEPFMPSPFIQQPPAPLPSGK